MKDFLRMGLETLSENTIIFMIIIISSVAFYKADTESLTELTKLNSVLLWGIVMLLCERSWKTPKVD